MTNKYFLTTEAQADVEAIFSYGLSEWGIEQSKKYLKNIMEKIELINDMPSIGKRHPEIDDWLFSFPCQSHMIYYFHRNDTLIIIAILHKSTLPTLHLQNRLYI